MNRALLMGVGSAGDVFPFIALGLGLKQRGWAVTLAANPTFETAISRLGLGFEPLNTREHYDRLTQNPDLWHTSKGTRTIIADQEAPQTIRKQYEISRQFSRLPGARVVVASSLGYGARIAREEHGLPLLTTHLNPIMMRCHKNPPYLPGGRLLNALVGLWPKLGYRLVDRIMDRMLAPTIEPIRRLSGRGPVRRYLDSWWNSPDGVLLLFPHWFGVIPTLPGNAKAVGFLQHEMDQNPADLVDLWKWMDAGRPPVVATFGSAMRHAGGLFGQLAEATAARGERLLILSKDPGQVPSPLPAHVLHANWAPMSQVLRKAALLVHHGGIGTVAQALGLAVPQLVIPFAHDQHDNAFRVQALGCGDLLFSDRVSKSRLIEKLGHLLSARKTGGKLGEISTKVRPWEAQAAACDLVEQAAR